METIVSRSTLLDFRPAFTAVGVYVFVGNEILFLQRHLSRNRGGYWCTPGGTLEKGEDAIDAAKRELFEETGIYVDTKELEYCAKSFIRYPKGGCDFLFYECRLKQSLLYKPDIVLSPTEHTDYMWATLQQAEYLSLIPGEWKRIMKSFNLS